MQNLIPTDNVTTINSFVFKPEGIEVVGDPSYDEWLECGKFIRRSNETVHFWIGDWLNIGQIKYGKTYAEAEEMFGYNYQTLRLDKWVALRIPTDRRNHNVSFGHYKAVANLESDEQEEVLEKAIQKGMSVRDIERYVQEQFLPAKKSQQEEQLFPRGNNADNEELNHLTIEAAVDLAEQLLDKINEIDFDSLNQKVRNDFLGKLEPVQQRVDGLFMTYQEDSQ